MARAIRGTANMEGTREQPRPDHRGRISRVRAILVLGRFPFLFGGFLLFSFGALLASVHGAPMDAPRFLLAYSIAFCGQLSVSYSNDFFDAEADAHNSPTPFSGGSGILVAHPELRPLSKSISLGLIALSMTLAAVFALIYPHPLQIILLAAAGNLLGWFYTAPPARLAYRGLGEGAMMLTVGVLLPGFGYYGMGASIGLPFLIFVPVMLVLGLIFIINVQVPDMEADALGGKSTVVTKRGRAFAFRLSWALAALAFVYLLVMAPLTVGETGPDLLVVAPLAAIPLAFTSAALLRLPGERQAAARHSSASVGSLFLFIGCVNVVLIFS